MGKPTGFLEIDRLDCKYHPVSERIKNFREFVIPLAEDELKDQASRCMDCGIPFCHDGRGNKGCPVNNQIPDWNHLVYRGEWQQASENLHSTNNFPEFTGRICPAPCEASCTLNMIDNPVTIKSLECAIVDKAWVNGWIKPEPSQSKTGKSIAIIGAGPAGMACAQQLVRAGHMVYLYEKNKKIGGLLRYGIPDFKMEKYLIDRRTEQIVTEGVIIHTGVHVGIDVDIHQLIKQNDAIVLSGGAEKPNDLLIRGRELKGIHFAMDFLSQQNRRISNEGIDDTESILAHGKHVVVIGGGDTGSDCIGTSIRQGALSVTQLEIMPMPPDKEDKLLTWPNWPLKMRRSSSHEEGVQRDFSVLTKSFEGTKGKVKRLRCALVDNDLKSIEDSEFDIEADLVLLAMGFISPKKEGGLVDLGIEHDEKDNLLEKVDHYKTNQDKIWSAGDMRRGQSLVVWAIREGRRCARDIDLTLMGTTNLPF
ncbi:glutamate synthase subunit beta [Candidatus Endowatersipora endosymbiont of Watersipora subatra]|uniref:glutamate synthase subunit beta n=1 Tax=Candidatus Endowatersipora endosymbiont of Watersipora subatra TaxID=3077946 RepID=UPI00312C8177